jgi:hypothetical protein
MAYTIEERFRRYWNAGETELAEIHARLADAERKLEELEGAVQTVYDNSNPENFELNDACKKFLGILQK